MGKNFDWKGFWKDLGKAIVKIFMKRRKKK